MGKKVKKNFQNFVRKTREKKPMRFLKPHRFEMETQETLF